MKRLIEILGGLKKISAVMVDASKNDNLIVVGGATAVTVNPKWLKATAEDLDKMADILGEIVAEKLEEKDG